MLALTYLVAIMVWLVVGDRLPGGRWLAVHLFTLGVLTTLVLTFSEHFGRTLTRTPGERAVWWPAVTNLGVLLTLVGLPARMPALVAAGTVVLTVVVFLAYRRLRGMRKQAVGARFTWIVRVYERAHGAFLHGAVIGGVLGIGVVPGGWHLGLRTAHLHANVLGWGGLTLLAWAAVAVCRPVAGAAWRAKPTASRPLVTAVAVWFPLVVVADVTVVATGAWRWLDPLGAAALIAVLGQAILATLTYLAPMLRGHSDDQRETIRKRLEVGSTVRAAAVQLAAVLVVLEAAPLGGLPPLSGVAWALLVAVVAATAAAALLPPSSRARWGEAAT